MKSVIKASAFILLLLLVSYVIPADAGTTYYFGGAKKTLSPDTVTIEAGYYDTTTLTTLIPGLAAGNIKSGTTIFGIIGTYGAGGMLPPTLTTATVTNISSISASATSGGNISTDGGSPVTARGVCWNTSGSPTITTGSITIEGSGGTGTFVSTINNLTPNTTYYVRAYATNSVGTSYGNEVNFFNPAITYAIGQSYGGGIVVYILQTGESNGVYSFDPNVQHGLIAATSDQASAGWGCFGYNIAGAGGTAIGTGHQNTHDMIAGGCNGAAQQVHGVTINGYSDWFLPSID